MVIAEEITIKSFNGGYIDQTRLYVKNNCDTCISVVLEKHGWSEPGKKEEKLI